jgi:kynurenine formamidase
MTLGDMISAEQLLDHLVRSVVGGQLELVDLSHPLTDTTPMIQLPPPLVEAPGWTLKEIARYNAAGPMYYWNAFEGSEHMGTHFDAPVHWITGKDGLDVSQIPVADLIGPAVVIDRTAEAASNADYLLTVDDILEFEESNGPLPKGGWLLLRTGWAMRHAEPERFVNAVGDGSHWPGMTVECAQHLAHETAITGYGVEHIGIDWGMAHTLDPMYPAHHFLLGAGKFGLASLAQLDRLPVVGSVLVAAPLRIVRGSGSPARVFALVARDGPTVAG